MDLRDALVQIAEIRQHLSRTEVFRGYRAAPVAFSGVLAVAGAGLQTAVIPEPSSQPGAYLVLWLSLAVLSIAAMAAGLLLHLRQANDPMTRTMTRLAVGQFVPCVVAGGLVTFVLWQYAAEALWTLPGLWSIMFGLGIFASCRLLPAGFFWIGFYYLVIGGCVLAIAQGDNAFSPWAMAIPFGPGQLTTAVFLYWTLERPHGED